MPTASKTPSGIHALACRSTLEIVHHSLTFHSSGSWFSADANTPDRIAARDSKLTFSSTLLTTSIVFASTFLTASLAERGVERVDERNTLGTLTDSGKLAMDVSASVTAPSDASESNNERGEGLRIG